ncbi:hypothetical protein [Myceligenerans xiligouense]|uniref:Uncharacterized protein n=1 Tax=Myceligenerans xiligouense TaxID=253184 RepID=A0A3N4ZJL5_9MICO|nr:hypothetical protein [Myceligenerans xiligouense]RPF20121.1 hypothetical protein EDD34_0699 [Myceligenerans xiligouense]
MTADTNPQAPTSTTDRVGADQAHAAALGELAMEAFCRTCRLVGDHVLLSVTLVAPGTLASAGTVALVMTHEESGAEHRFDVGLYEQQRKQWHVDLDVLVPARDLAGQVWRGDLHLDGVLIPLRQVSSGQDRLLAVSDGLLPANTPPAELSVPPLQDVIRA